jgi:hypothetical protein
MSHSVLYQCFGIQGYHHLKIWRAGGVTFLKIVRTTKRCSVCSSWNVIQKGYRCKGFTGRPQAGFCGGQDAAVLLPGMWSDSVRGFKDR